MRGRWGVAVTGRRPSRRTSRIRRPVPFPAKGAGLRHAVPPAVRRTLGVPFRRAVPPRCGTRAIALYLAGSRPNGKVFRNQSDLYAVALGSHGGTPRYERGNRHGRLSPVTARDVRRVRRDRTHAHRGQDVRATATLAAARTAGAPVPGPGARRPAHPTKAGGHRRTPRHRHPRRRTRQRPRTLLSAARAHHADPLERLQRSAMRRAVNGRPGPGRSGTHHTLPAIPGGRRPIA